MDRREFLKQVAAWSAGAALVTPVFSIDSWLAAAQEAPKVPSTLVVARGKDYAAIVAAAIEKLGGMGQFVKPGNKVVIKPNIGWDRKPEHAANTHPDVIQSLAKLASAQQPKQVQVFDVTCNEARRCYTNSGILAAIESLKDPLVTCPFCDSRKFVPVQIEHGKAINQWDLYRDAVEADCYINAPIAKHHGLTKLTLGFKNIMGIMGGGRGRIHQDIAQKLADLNSVVRPKLTVIDATRILLRNGPAGGKLEDVKQLDTLIVSADPVAADAYATTLFGMQPRDVLPTVRAYEMGLGEIDLSKVNIIEV